MIVGPSNVTYIIQLAYTHGFARVMFLNDCQWSLKNKWNNEIQISLRNWTHALFIYVYITTKSK